jgi:hypothetical protein
MVRVVHPGSGPDFLASPDPGVKKAPVLGFQDNIVFVKCVPARWGCCWGLRMERGWRAVGGAEAGRVGGAAPPRPARGRGTERRPASWLCC